MSDFYHRSALSQNPCPAVMGLSATPSIRSNPQELVEIEYLIDAISISPTLHREELLKCVNKPELCALSFIFEDLPATANMESLHQQYLNLKIENDPYIKSLYHNPTDRNMRALETAVNKNDTFCMNQFKGLWRRCNEIHRQLGPWAADYYIWKAISLFLDTDHRAEQKYGTWLSDEKHYLATQLRNIPLTEPCQEPLDQSLVSDKFQHLLIQLIKMEDTRPVVGIIFVKERATAIALCALLSQFSVIRDRYRTGFIVGTTGTAVQKSIYDLPSEHDLQALQNFRSGKINLLIATAVLEEGIDVPACNLVICYDMPSTPKAFIQRRGRARMRDSKLILLMEENNSRLQEWETMVKEMDRLYRTGEREREQMMRLENEEKSPDVFLEDPTTGARVDFDSAKSHLEHFCKALSQGEFIDCRPDYIIHRDGSSESSAPLMRAQVLLPAFVPQDLRSANGESLWHSEKNATKDAAFQAYSALYRAGLVTKHMLPFKSGEFLGLETRKPEVNVAFLKRPWLNIATAWQNHTHCWTYTISWVENNQVISKCEMVLPVYIQKPRSIRVYLDSHCECELVFSEGERITAAEGQRLPDHTTTLLAANFEHRWAISKQNHIIRFFIKDQDLSTADIGRLEFDPADESVRRGDFLIRDQAKSPHVFKKLLPRKPPLDSAKIGFKDYDEAPDDVPYISFAKWTKRSDFLHSLSTVTNAGTPEVKSKRDHPRVLPMAWASVDTISTKHVRFGMLIPSIIHEVEMALVAKELETGLLAPIGIGNHNLVREAISAKGAAEPVNYERLEFLGDSVLKYCSSIQAIADHPHWPEGYLSLFKDQLVSNSRLSRAALNVGLAESIVTMPFTGIKWRPLYVESILTQPETTAGPGRKLSTKVLADVVEALIGGSFVVGGIPKALDCMNVFMDDYEFKDVDTCRRVVFDLAPDNEELPPVLEPIEGLLGYVFRKKSLLLEAVTHGSFISGIHTRSFEQLEFLGDAVLDKIIVTKLFAHNPPLAHYEMHMIKTAMVNKDFLAFIVMQEYETKQLDKHVTENNEIVTSYRTTALWKYLRHASHSIGLEQAAMVKRYGKLKDEISTTLNHGTHYPWALLARMNARKFYSDQFEAVLGAIWVDSGSLEECEAVIDKFGILNYMERVLRDSVHMQHPKEELGIWTGNATVTYQLSVDVNVSGEKCHNCSILVGARKVVEVTGGVNKEEVKTKAAEAAVKLLTAESNGDKMDTT